MAHPTWVRMLHDHDGRLLVLHHCLKSGIDVRDVVVTQFLALELGGAEDTRALGHAAIRGIEGSTLMGILAIAQPLLLEGHHREQICQAIAAIPFSKL